MTTTNFDRWLATEALMANARFSNEKPEDVSGLVSVFLKDWDRHWYTTPPGDRNTLQEYAKYWLEVFYNAEH